MTLNWIVKTACEMPDMTDALAASTLGMPVRPLAGTLKKDEVKDALLTLVLALVLQGDYQQAKDYVQKLTESCAPAPGTDLALGAAPALGGSGDIVPLQTASEFTSLLTDFVVCESFFLPLRLNGTYTSKQANRWRARHRTCRG